MRYALEHSLNTVAVKALQQAGIDKTLYFAQQMGITTLVLSGDYNDRNLAMALGGLTRGVTPLEIASAYGVLANRGVKVDHTAIIKVLDRDGKVLEENTPQGKAVVSEKSVYLLTDMMVGVINNGTGTGARIGRPAAGKTGTTSDWKDAWFVGFTPDLAAAVWVGHDDNYSLGSGITGSTLPASLWRDFMVNALAGRPAENFYRPAGVVAVRVSNSDGLLPKDPKAKNAHTEVFVEGTQPSKVSPSDDKDKDGKDKDDKDKDDKDKDDKDGKDNNGKDKDGKDNGNPNDKTNPPPPPKNSQLPPPPPKPTPPPTPSVPAVKPVPTPPATKTTPAPPPKPTTPANPSVPVVKPVPTPPATKTTPAPPPKPKN